MVITVSFQYLLLYHIQVGETALHMAAHKGDSITLTVLLKYSPKLDALDIVR